MHRIRNFQILALSFLILFSRSTAGLAEEPDRSQPTAKPNVLMIAIDDLNDWVGPLKGHPQVQTPSMDRLAARDDIFKLRIAKVRFAIRREQA